MSKKLKDLQWQPVTLEGFPISMSETFQGFVGLEECTEYGLDKEKKPPKQKKQRKLSSTTEKTDQKKQGRLPSKTEKTDEKKQGNLNSKTEKIDQKKQKQKRKNTSESEIKEVPSKKVKLSNGFVVESYNNSVTPSPTNEICNNNQNNTNTKHETQSKAKKENPKNTTDSNKKVNKPKLGEVTAQMENILTPEDMLTWSEFKLQEPIMRALTELGFKTPTKIQQLSLPAALHGRRDILGAAETGSGKTLAFGLPILSGILKLKEKAAAKGLDVYDILFKKNSAKKKNVQQDHNVKGKSKKPTQKKNAEKDNRKSKKDDREMNNNNKIELKAKESSEDGYSSGDDNSTDDDDVPVKTSRKKAKVPNKRPQWDDEFFEEIEVPIRKRDNSADEGNDSGEDSYTHLSEMLDSDDSADNSDDENSENDTKAEADLENVENSDNGSENDEANSESDVDKSESDNDEDENEVEGTNDEAETEVEGTNDGVEDSDEGMDEVLGDDGEEENKTAGGIGCVKVVDNIEIPEHMVVKTGKPLYALILTPTRELAMQVSRHLIAAAKYTGIRVATIVGGMAAVKQERVLRYGPEVVVATPGRLWELIGQGQPHLQQLDSVKFLAIDETDRMIERGHFEELHPLLERLNIDEERRNARQNFVFSATLTLVHDLPTHMKGKKVTKRGKILNRKIEKMTPQQKVKRLIDMIGMTDPKVVDITTENLGTAETLTECKISCSLDQKDSYLYYIYKRHPGRTIVFCNSIGSVRRLAQIFTILKCQPLPLHASMPQRQRLKNLERFRDDPRGLLIATDVAARGLDIPNVDHVVQYHVPRTAENYVHRSGRTARANKEGINVLMVEPSEAYLYSKLCHTLNKASAAPSFPVASHVLAPLHQLMITARELDALELKKKRLAQARGWREKAAADMDMIIDDDDVPVQAMDPSIDRALKAKRRQLDSMLSRPVYPKGFSFKYPSLNDPNALRNNEDNALQVMKKALESGQLKKEMRLSKNAPLLTLSKVNKNNKRSNNKKSKNNKKK